MSILTSSWRTRQWRLLTAAFIVGYVGVTCVLLVPMGLSLWHQRAQIAEQTAQVAQARTWAATEPRTHARIQTLRERVRRLHRESTPVASVAALFPPLEDAARQAGLTVTALTADTSVVHARQIDWPLHLQATGRYHQVGVFLDHLERGPARIIINRLDLTAPKMTSATVILQLDLIRSQFTTSHEDR